MKCVAIPEPRASLLYEQYIDYAYYKGLQISDNGSTINLATMCPMAWTPAKLMRNWGYSIRFRGYQMISC